MKSVAPLDPYLLMLKEQVDVPPSDGPSGMLSSVETLQFLQLKAISRPETLHSLDAQNAVLLAGELGIPAPKWAVERLRTVQQSKLCDRKIDLDKEFGFVAIGKGNPSEVERRLREQIQDESMLNIWQLVLLEVPLKRACFLEAGRRQKLHNWDVIDYDIAVNLGSRKKNDGEREQELYDKRLAFAEQLRQQYYSWRTEIEKDPNSAEATACKQRLLPKREVFLAQFPAN